MTGFKRFVSSNISLQVDENRCVQIVLQVGNVTDSVAVQAEVAQVETRSGAIREVVDAKRSQELPLNGRNALDLQLLVPGAGAQVARDQAQNELVAINGTRITQNNYTSACAGNTVSLVGVGAQSTVIPTAPPGMLCVGDQGITNKLGPFRYAKFAPRFGFAWDPSGNGRMSVRGGYGIFVSARGRRTP